MGAKRIIIIPLPIEGERYLLLLDEIGQPLVDCGLFDNWEAADNRVVVGFP